MDQEALTEDTAAVEAPRKEVFGDTRARRATRPAERSARPRPPRLGSFITIAAAVLMLFGAVSRMGKIPETAALFGIDRQAENRIRREEERLRTALTIGAVPVAAADLRPQSAGVRIDPGVLPPQRPESEPEDVLRRGQPDAGSRSAMSMAVPEDFWKTGPDGETSGERGGINEPAPTPRTAAAPARAAGETYVVANGDTWARIAKKFLGDGKRWPEIQNANPEARDGLRVGMRLIIPKV